MFSASKAAAICGHAEKIARKHYWMVTADDITAMAQCTTPTKAGAHLVQYPAATSGIGSQEVRTAKAKSPEKPGFASRCDKLLVGQMGRGGIEPPTPGFSGRSSWFYLGVPLFISSMKTLVF
ncbi:MAG: hypothetical protein KDA91_14835 [Planctomycetaceae bacterium]|nr:hypothetical protein [Planctomycetaceae bacterium]